MNQSSDKTGTSDTTKTNGKPFVLKPVEGVMARMSSSNVCVAREDFLRANEVLAGRMSDHTDVSDAPTVSTDDGDDDADEQLIEQGRELARRKDENAALRKEVERLKLECGIANVFSLRAVKGLWQLPLNAQNETYVPTNTNASVVTQLPNTDVRITPIELPMTLGDPEARIGIAGDYILHVAVVSYQDGSRYMLTYEHPDLDEPFIRFRPLKGLKSVRIEHERTLVIELTFFRQREGAVMKAFALKMLGQRGAATAMKDERISAQLVAGEPTEGQ